MIRNTIHALIGASALLLAGPASAATHELVTTHRFPASAGLSADLENLAGAVVIEGTDGKELVIEAKVVASDDSDAEARALAALIGLDAKKEGNRVVLHARYPLDEYREYRYDRGGDGGKGWWGWNTSTEYQGKSVRIGARGVDLHVDFKIMVPKGVAVRFRNVVGTLDAARVEGDLDLDTGSGPIAVRDGRGKLRADTGSGAVKVLNHVGDLLADTGSGSVTLDNVQGNVDADTGSGSIRVSGSKGRDFEFDTGSGRISIEDSSAESLAADTGSGGFGARGLAGVKRLAVDSGSGSVKIEGDLSALRDVDIDTGSGGVTLTTSQPLNLRLDVSAGSGGIDVDLDNLSNVRTSRGDFSGVAGKGEGSARISTGSGGTRIRQQ